MTVRRKTNVVLACLITLLFVNAPVAGVYAQEDDIVPPLHDGTVVSVDEDEGMLTTHPLLRLTPDKSELVRLDSDAVSIVVGNPEHLSVLLDTPRLMVLVPRVPGATHFSALDKEGNVIMQRHVIVASPKKNYVRIRRSCANGGEGCRSTSVYYCPDMCHEVHVEQSNSGAASAEEGSGSTGTEGDPDLVETTETPVASE